MACHQRSPRVKALNLSNRFLLHLINLLAQIRYTRLSGCSGLSSPLWCATTLSPVRNGCQQCFLGYIPLTSLISEMLYGATIRIPGELFTLRDRRVNLRSFMDKIKAYFASTRSLAYVLNSVMNFTCIYIAIYAELRTRILEKIKIIIAAKCYNLLPLK